MNRKLINEKTWVICKPFLFIIFSSLLFLLAFSIQRNLIRVIADFVRNGFITLIISIAFVLSFINIFRGDFGKFVRLNVIVIIFALLILGLWSNVITENNSIGGLIPRSDSNSYFTDSLRILNGMKASYISIRTNFTVFLSFLLLITKQNMQITLAIIIFIAALVTYFSYELILREFGSIPSIIFFLLLFFFYRPSSGKFMTENIGFILGLLGFSLLIIYLKNQNTYFYYFGLTCTTLALYIRPGPIFIIPIIIISINLLQGFTNSKKWALIGRGFLIVLICVILQNIFSKLFLIEGSTQFANYSYVLYGLSKGGIGWGSIRLENPNLFDPEIVSASDLFRSEVVNWVMMRATQNILTDPSLFLHGLLRQYPLLFNISNRMGLFSFFYTKNQLQYYASQYFLYFLSVFGIIFLAKTKEKIKILILSFIGGVMLSIPFLPFSDQMQMRAYAGTIGFIALIPTLGVYYLMNLFVKNYDSNKYIATHREYNSFNYSLLIFSVIALIFVCIMPFSMIVRMGKLPDSNLNCPNGLTPALISFGKGSTINILPEEQVEREWMPNIEHQHFITSIHLYPYDNFVKSFEKLEPPYSITPTIDLLTNKGMLLISNPEKDIFVPGVQLVCGKWYSDNINYMYSKPYYIW